MKPDPKAFPVLKDISEFDSWYKDAYAMAKAQGVDSVFHPQLRPHPNDTHGMERFYHQQTFMYAVLRQKIKPVELREYVENECETSDAMEVLMRITTHVRASTYAIITLRDMIQHIVSDKLVPGKHNGSVYSYIVMFNQSMELYNKQQTSPELKINEHQKRLYLQNSVSLVKQLRAVAERETDRVVTGGVGFNYYQYMEALKSVATQMDAAKKRGERSINQLLIGDGYDSDEDDSQRQIVQYAINEVKRRYLPPSELAGKMDKATWGSLKDHTKKVWDTIDNEDKGKVLNYAQERAERRQAKVHDIKPSGAPPIQANAHEIEKDDEKEDEADDKAPDERRTMQVNSVMSRARSEAHPGDPRRMMGGDGADTKTQLQAMMHAWGNLDPGDESDDGSTEDYWNDQDFQ